MKIHGMSSELYHTQSSASEQVISQASNTISRNKSNSSAMEANGQEELTKLTIRTIFLPTWIYCNARNFIKCLFSYTHSFRSTKELYRNMKFCHFFNSDSFLSDCLIQTEFSLRPKYRWLYW